MSQENDDGPPGVADTSTGADELSVKLEALRVRQLEARKGLRDRGDPGEHAWPGWSGGDSMAFTPPDWQAALTFRSPGALKPVTPNFYLSRLGAAPAAVQPRRPGGRLGRRGADAGRVDPLPGISVNSFQAGGGRGVFLSQVFPGAGVGESTTIQTYLAETPPDAAARAEIAALCDFLAGVVGEEDLPTSFGQQKAFETGLVRDVRFGRNEGGLQNFHRWVEAVSAGEASV